ncbi:phosphatidylserine/phosphatidylglycerophosphate/cardiolipin synthase family protein [Sphingomonas gilva]|uniref:Phospholipase D n=1 Tax=Sphingomonas gilva TaxID=2305907 RepID=A0A396RQ24_9SPHN|nr:phosphatidylserine/phosphatidylglycerophosphate/cardiolipin synthase family protein [Sphingomonas gilva]RHW18667.1 phosphatidylserine/phosphatidylglycerophosphate/cardiolipin synthase family protein [Sphingomonas gilva]
MASSPAEQPPEQPWFTVDGNRLRLLDTGPRRLEALIALIDGAERSLRVLFYIYTDDHAGRRVRDAMVAAQTRGVQVSLIVDGFGSEVGGDDDFFRPLTDAGGELCRFLPRFGRRYLLRNHQKLALADEARVITGGFNVEDDYFGTPAEDAWRDLGVEIDGPAAGRIARYFDDLSAWARDDKARIRTLRRALKRASETSGGVRWLLGGPTRRLSPWAQALRADIRGAAQVDMIAAYFAPGPGLLRRIDRARRVRLITAAKSDNNATIAAARFTYAGLLRQGAKIFEFQPTKLHTKLYVIDDIVHIGSANFDMRSLFINLEIMVRIDDAAFAAHVRGYFEGEMAKSEAITAEVNRRRSGWWTRIRQFAAYLLIAVLDYNVSRRLNFGIDGR